NRPTRFVGTGLPLSETGPNRLVFTNNPGALTNAILPQGVVTGPGGTIDLASYGSSPEGVSIIPVPAALYVTDINQAGPTSNVRLTATTALTTNRSINSLLVDGGASLTALANAVLTVGSG